jgi:dihydrofolate reductase
MGNLVVTEFMTLDGVMEDPGGGEPFERGGWAFAFERGPEGDRFKMDELEASDAQLLGRKTYEGFARAWPQMADNPFGEKMNAGDLPTEVERLKQRFDGDILVAGSAQLVQGLLRERLVDELRLMVYPVVLGAGKRLFADGLEQLPFDLVETKQTGSVAIVRLRRQSS